MSIAPPIIDPARVSRLNMWPKPEQLYRKELALLAVLDSDPAFRALGWPAVVTAYRNALETVLEARAEAERKATA